MEKIPEQSPRLELIEEFQELANDPEFSKELKERAKRAYQIVKQIFLTAGYEMQQDINNVYDAVKEVIKEAKTNSDNDLFVRNEDISRLVESISQQRALELKPRAAETMTKIHGEDYQYNNCAMVTPINLNEALRNCYNEGYSGNLGMTAIIGFIGKEKEATQLAGIKNLSPDIFYAYDRSYRGHIPLENVKFITLRIPAQNFPEEEMTKEEQKRIVENRRQQKSNFILKDFY